MKFSKLSIFFLLVSMVSCKDDWNAHYDENLANVANMKSWEFLQSKPEYSEFTALLQKTNSYKVFETNQRYTIWAPKNGKLPDVTAMTDSALTIVLKNYISLVDYPSSSFYDGLPLKTFSGKSMLLRKDPDNTQLYLINGASRIVKTDMACLDGVIHEVDTMLAVRPVIYDYMMENPRYERLQELITSQIDSLFDAVNSEKIGETSTGKPLYDSIFIKKNRILNWASIDKDNRYYTAFLPTNECLDAAIAQFYNDLRAVRNEEPNDKDSLALENWILGSVVYGKAIDKYGEEQILSSVRGVKWNTLYQQVNVASRKEFSNGFTYDVDKLFIPRSLLMEKELSYSAPAVCEKDPERLEVYVTGDVSAEDVTIQKEVKMVNRIKYLSSDMTLKAGPSDNIPLFQQELTWRASRVTEILDEEDPDFGETRINDIAMLPGEYSVQLTFYKTVEVDTDFEVYVNGIYVNTVDISKFKTNGTSVGVSLGRVNIPETTQIEPATITLKSTGNGHKKSLTFISILFKPTPNNY
ncbi:MAG: fasciclin domain-containing protein [Bacteroidales bacterium]